MEGSTMSWRHKFASGVLSIGAVAVLAAVVPAFVAQASVATVARGVVRAPLAVPQPPSGKPAFDATFGGKRLNSKDWDTCYPMDSQRGCTNFGNHMEAEWYLPSQVRVSGGVLHLVARRKRTVGTTKTGAREVYGCRSGMITSYPGFKFKYGFVQVVANIPHANGLWPALWLEPANGQDRPEIDMVESWGVNALTASFYHPVAKRRNERAEYSPALTRGWQTYSLSWTRYRLRYYIGSKLILNLKRAIPDQPMYFLADLAEYLPARPGDCSGQLKIRSVKIWKG
jgi:beta-glucanase (GH16 family)